MFVHPVAWSAVVEVHITSFSFTKLWYLIENNTFFEFIKLSFLKVILSLYIQSFLSSYCSTFYYVHKVLFYKNGSLLCWTVVLFSRLKLYCKRKYHRFESCFSRAYLQPALLRRHFSND